MGILYDLYTEIKIEFHEIIEILLDIFENFGRKIKVFAEKIKKNVWLFVKKLEFLNIFFFELYGYLSAN